MSFKIFHGDCLDTLKRAPDNSMDSIVTDTDLYRGLDDDKDASIQRGLVEFKAGQFADAPSMDDRDWLEDKE